MNLGIHIIPNPTGGYSLAGSIPKKLMAVRPAQKTDYLAGTVIKNSGYSISLAYYCPSFDTYRDAVKWIEENGFEVSQKKEVATP